jgi:choline dehydrogenase-like flavoprotein
VLSAQMELERFFRDGLVTFWHQCGTAKMGRDETSVVDAQLKVYGVKNLRIADSSILPRVTTGNTMAPCVVIGEQAAAFLLSPRAEERHSGETQMGDEHAYAGPSNKAQVFGT